MNSFERIWNAVEDFKKDLRKVEYKVLGETADKEATLQELELYKSRLMDIKNQLEEAKAVEIPKEEANEEPFLLNGPLGHDIWNWESEFGAWILAMKQAGLDQETISKVVQIRNTTNNMHPGDAAKVWWEFKCDI